jgi:hypothetical protein
MSVKLTVTDTLGNTATLYSGQGSQPALQLKTTPWPVAGPAAFTLTF